MFLQGHDIGIGIYSSEAACLRLGREVKELDFAILKLTVQPEALGPIFEVKADHLSCLGLHFGVHEETSRHGSLGLQKAEKWTCEVVLQSLTTSSLLVWESSDHVSNTMLALYIVLEDVDLSPLEQFWSVDSLVLELSCVASQARVPIDETHEGLHGVPRW